MEKSFDNEKVLLIVHQLFWFHCKAICSWTIEFHSTNSPIGAQGEIHDAYHDSRQDDWHPRYRRRHEHWSQDRQHPCLRHRLQRKRRFRRQDRRPGHRLRRFRSLQREVIPHRKHTASKPICLHRPLKGRFFFCFFFGFSSLFPIIPTLYYYSPVRRNTLPKEVSCFGSTSDIASIILHHFYDCCPQG